MKKAVVLGIVIVLGAMFLLGCAAKELRTAKIELGMWNKPKSNPNLERVKENLRLAEQKYPNDAEVYHLWGRVYAQEDNYVEMAKAFEKSDELSDKFTAINDTIRMVEWDVLFKAAIENYKAEDYEGTLANLKNAIICWPRQFEPYLYGADAAYRLGLHEEAYNLSKKGYELVPDSMNVAAQYASMCLLNMKYDEAQNVYKTLQQKDPTNAQHLFNLSEISLVQNDTAQAVVYARQALEIDKDFAEGWLNLAKLYFMLKKYCEAAEAYEHYLPLVDKPNKDDHFLYILALYQCEENDKAKIELEKFTMDNPEECDAWQILANTYLRLKMKKEALEADKKYKNCSGN